MATLWLERAMSHDNESEHQMKPHDMIKPLADHYVPIVMNVIQPALGDVTASLRYTVEFVEAMPSVNGLRFSLNVEIIGGELHGVDEIKAFADLFDIFGMNNPHRFAEMFGREPPANLTLDGYAFALGDGDDSMAVQFNGRAFRIWLRGWR